jgi:hypothetical protein
MFHKSCVTYSVIYLMNMWGKLSVTREEVYGETKIKRGKYLCHVEH